MHSIHTHTQTGITILAPDPERGTHRKHLTENRIGLGRIRLWHLMLVGGVSKRSSVRMCLYIYIYRIAIVGCMIVYACTPFRSCFVF